MKKTLPILCKTFFCICSRFKISAITPRSLFLLSIISLYQVSQCQSPGGVSSGLYLWLKADAGVVQSSGNVSQWTNQASASMTTQVSKTATSSVSLVNNGINLRPVIRFDGTQSMKGTYATAPTQPAMIYAVAIGRSGTPNIANVYSNAPAGAMGLLYDATTGKYAVDLSGGSCSGSSSMVNQPALVRVYYQAASGSSPGAASGSYTSINSMPLTSCGSDGKLTTPNGNLEIGGRTWDVTTRIFTGDIAEVIYYNSNTASAAQINQIESYLAFKYGIALGNTSGLRNYVASDGTVFWNGNGTYQNNIFGIGADNASGLNITQSNSMNTGNGDGSGQSGKANLVLSTSSTLSDKQFLMIGDDGGSLVEQNTNLPSAYSSSSRLGRTWKVKNTGSVGAVNISLDRTGLVLGGGTDPSKYRLMVNTNGSNDFTSGTPIYYTASSVTGSKTNFTGVTLSDNSVFTFITNGISLPVTWMSFTSTSQNGNIILKWKTADEVEVEKYEIEHSVNGINFTVIANVKAKSGSGANDYEYRYAEPSEGLNYYRIKEVDRDGRYHFSRINTVSIPKTFVLQMQSNLVLEALLLTINSEKEVQSKFRICNFDGKIFLQKDQYLHKGNNPLKFNTAQLSPGLYFLQAEIGGAVSNIKFLKQ